ncbi:MAG: PIN domain-containing protein [Verrucomicrobia bacterium]|nr:PIN domain-containing protein [Verrucomicrobiota bacterium]
MALFLPDANVLIHALRKGTAAHPFCRRWLVDAMGNGDDLGLCELVEVALLRIPTLPKLQLVPISEVLGFWGEDLWTYAGTRRLVPGARHKETLTRFVMDLQLVGNDLNDAWLAALAVEHRATLVSSDHGFSRFPGLAWLDPAAG